LFLLLLFIVKKEIQIKIIEYIIWF